MIKKNGEFESFDKFLLRIRGKSKDGSGCLYNTHVFLENFLIFLDQEIILSFLSIVSATYITGDSSQ